VFLEACTSVGMLRMPREAQKSLLTHINSLTKKLAVGAGDRQPTQTPISLMLAKSHHQSKRYGKNAHTFIV
jgi:hypothetical protein